MIYTKSFMYIGQFGQRAFVGKNCVDQAQKGAAYYVEDTQESIEAAQK